MDKFKSTSKEGTKANPQSNTTNPIKRCGFFVWFFFFFFLVFLWLLLRHMGVPSLGVESELRLLAYATAAATSDPSCICDPCHSLW